MTLKPSSNLPQILKMIEALGDGNFPEPFAEGELAQIFAKAKEAAEKIQSRIAAHDIFRRMSDASSVLMSYWNAERICLAANQNYARAFDLTPETIIGRHMKEVIGQSLFELNAPLVEKVLRGERQAFERAEPRPDKEWRHGLVDFIPDYREEKVVGFFVIVTDVTEIAMREKKLSLIMEFSNDGYSVQDANSKVVQTNEAACRILGMSEDELLGRTCADPQWVPIRLDGTYFPPEEHPTMVTLRTGQSFRGQIMGLNGNDGSRRWIRVNTVPFHPQGTAANLDSAKRFVLSTFTDVTLELKSSGESDRLFLLAPSAICVLGDQGEIQRVNPYFVNALGFEEAEILAKNFMELLGPEDQAAAKEAFRKCEKLGDRASFENRISRKDQKYAHFSWEIQKDPVSGLIFAMGRDITNERRIEEDRQFTFDALGVGTFRYDMLSGRVEWDKALHRLYGTNPETFGNSYEDWISHVASEDLEMISEDLKRAYNGEKDFSCNFQVDNEQLGKRYIAARGKIVRNQAGVPIAMYGINLDCTKEVEQQMETENLRRNLEFALALAKKSEKRFRTLFENSPLGIAQVDGDGYYNLVNPAFCQMLGYDENELRQMNFVELSHPSEREYALDRLHQFVSMGSITSKIERRYIHKSGHEVHTRLTSRVVQSSDGKSKNIFSIVEDVTEQRRNEGERNLLQIERNTMLRSARFMLVFTDADGVITGFSDEAQRLCGYSAAEVVGKVTPEILHCPKEVDQLRREMNAELGLNIQNPMEAFMILPIRGAPFEKEMHYIAKDGRRFPVLINITALRDEKGAIYGYMAFVKDLTEEKKIEAAAEIEKAKLNNNAKLASLGEMAGGVAHEINNPLATIQLIASQLGEVLHEPEIDKELATSMADSITKTTDRIAQIVQGLRTFSRDGSHDPFRRVPVRQLVADTASFCNERLRSGGIDFIIEEISDQLFFDGRAVQVSQVLLNLLNNAHDAIQPLAEKWVRISVKADDSQVEIRVTDSGDRISPEIQAKLFQPFFTTKEVGKGTGMGLSISLGIIKVHHGELFLDPKNEHTCFVIRLPRLYAEEAVVSA